MKNICLLLCMFCISFFAQAQDSSKKVPGITVKTLEGKAVNISDYTENGKITVLSFWATWCSPCKRELDAIADYYEEWQEDYDMELVAITIDDARTLPRVRGMVATKGWEYTVLSDVNEELKRALGFSSVPMTILVDQNGNIVYRHNSYSPGDELELEDHIKEIAGK